MKKGFKKFLGAMIVLSIFGGNVGIGASSFYSSGLARDLAESARIGINELRSSNVTPVASMTPEEVKIMDEWAELIFIFCEMADTDPSQWDNNFSVRLKKLCESSKSCNHKPLSCDPKLFWKWRYSKKEAWKRADSLFTKFGGIFRFFHGGTVREILHWVKNHRISI